MNIIKLAKSYVLNKNKTGLTKLHSYLSVFGILFGVTALIVVSSAMSGFKNNLYQNIHVDFDVSVSLNKTSPMSIDKLIENYKIKEVKEYKKFNSNVEIYLNNQNFENLIISKDNLKYELDSLYISSSFSFLDDKILPLSLRPKGLFENRNEELSEDDIYDQAILNVKFSENIPLNRVYVSQDTYDSNFFIDIESEKLDMYGLVFEDFMDSQSFITENKTNGQIEDLNGWITNQKEFFNSLKIEETVIKIVLFFVLLVSSFNIVSTLTLMITEKKQDIYILKTIGYSNKEVLLTFLMTGVIIGFFGLILGTITGILITVNLTEILLFLENVLFIDFIPKSITEFPYLLNIKEIIIINILTAFIILISSLIPAINTLRITPAEGLKDE